MCEPVSTSTAIIAGLTTASAGYTLFQQNRQANIMEAQMRQAQQDQQEQIADQASVKADDRARRARAERARLRARNAESGLTGITTETLVRDRDVAAGRDLGRIALSQDNQLTSSSNRLQSNLNQIQQPDFIGTALNTGLTLAASGGFNKGTETAATDLNDIGFNPVTRQAPAPVPGFTPAQNIVRGG